LLENGINEKRIYLMSPYMFAMQEQQYFNPDFMRFCDEEVFVDAGSYDLSTSIKLLHNCNKIKRVYAFEPDDNNFSICQKRSVEFNNDVIRLIKAATWDKNDMITFDASFDGSSHVSLGGNGTIKAIPIDSVIEKNDNVTFIKMDVEGSELQSLIGAEQTIRRCTPKLAICMYHKPEDMYTIPTYIKSLNSKYKLYIRHHSNGAGETVLYAIP